jgi:two-component system, sensor histidine kinase and response regulator
MKRNRLGEKMTTVLVIEDEYEIRTNLVEVLSLNDFIVYEAENGLMGLEIAKEHLPDLIICDINMPGMDGYRVLQELRTHPQTATTPFVFLTAQTDKTFMRQGMNLGADDYLTKPFTWDELLTAVKSRLEKQDLVAKETEQKLDNLRGSILHALPHELRTPLTGIIGSAELIVDFGATMDRQTITNMGVNILESGNRLYHLIENYLLYAQLEVIQTDRERIKKIQEYRVEHPEEIITQAAEQQAGQVQRGNDLILKASPMPPLQISSESLEKIVVELVDNALKFSAKETPVEIEMAATDRFYLQIRDNGRGMTAEQIKNIAPYIQFDRKFYEQQGAGLGLAIVGRLVELHRGQLTIESAFGKSTTVTVTFPLANLD